MPQDAVRRRAGHRAGHLPAEVRTAIRGEVGRLAALTDPIAVIVAVGDAYAALDAEMEQLARVRIRAVAELRAEGWSYERIAHATGLSKARVAQLAKDPRA